jgi:hypothetical protein
MLVREIAHTEGGGLISESGAAVKLLQTTGDEESIQWTAVHLQSFLANVAG